MNHSDVTITRQRIEDLIANKFSVSNASLRRNLGKLKHKLPRGTAEDARYILKSEKLARHPRTRMMVDPAGLETAKNHLTENLRKYDGERAFSRSITMFVGINLINLILYAVLFYLLIKWVGVI